MASKRLKDLDSATLALTYKMIFDQAVLTEAEQSTIEDFLLFVESEYIHTETFDVGDTVGSPNWDLNINHELNSPYVSVTLWDNSGYEKSTSGIVSIVDSDNIRLRFHHAITGTWKVKISKF